MKILTSLLFCFISSLAFGQLSSEKQKLIAPLLQTNYAEFKNIGNAGTESKIYKEFDKIKQQLSNDDLAVLANNSSNALRLYSSFELLYRGDKRIVDIYKSYKTNPVTMKYLDGCVGDDKNIADFIYLEFEKTIAIQKTLEENLNKIPEKEKRKNSYYASWQRQLNAINKIITPSFTENFDKIKHINHP